MAGEVAIIALGVRVEDSHTSTENRVSILVLDREQQ